jgi:hypothetical protein
MGRPTLPGEIAMQFTPRNFTILSSPAEWPRWAPQPAFKPGPGKDAMPIHRAGRKFEGFVDESFGLEGLFGFFIGHPGDGEVAQLF